MQLFLNLAHGMLLKVKARTPSLKTGATRGMHRWKAMSRIQRLKGRGPALALIIATFSPILSHASSNLACEEAMTRAANLSGIPINVLYAVGLTETGQSGILNPYAMNVDGRPIQSHNLPDALAHFAIERSRGAHFIDIGCMQVNYQWHSAKFHSISDMFDPGQNVRYAAALLKELRTREGNWTLAIARYNAGPGNNVAQKAYVCAVIKHIVSSGMGNWTPAARNFCE